MANTVGGTASQEELLPRKATRESLPGIAETLALAFYDDPVMMWCVTDQSRRREILPSLFGAIGDSYSSHDEIYDLVDSVSAAVWAPPGAEDDEERASSGLRAITRRVPLAVGPT